MFYSEIDWEKLPPSELKLIEHNKSLINLRRNEILYDEGSLPKGVYIVKKGKLKLFLRMADGTEQIIFIYTSGECIGFRPLIAGEKQPAITSAIEPSQLEFIPAEIFIRVLENSHTLNRILLCMMSKEFNVWVSRFAFNTQKDVKQRMALALLVLNEKFKARQSLVKTSSIHLSKTELAGIVGTSLETIIRTLKKFTEEEIVKVTGKNMVVLNHKELLRVAGIA
jgi:CRP-like cAMP-binding protein